MQAPVISSDIVGLSELVQPDTGKLVPPGDPAALAESMQALHATGESGRAVMGRRGRAVIASDYDLLKGVRELAALFRHTVGRDDTFAQLA